MYKLLPLLIVYLLTTAHSGEIDLDDGWEYHSATVAGGSNTYAIRLKQTVQIEHKERMQFKSISFFCSIESVGAAVDFGDHSVDPSLPLIYAFDDGPILNTTEFEVPGTQWDVFLEGKLVMSWLESMSTAKFLHIQVTNVQGLAERYNVEIADNGHIFSRFLKDCDYVKRQK